MGRSEKSSNPNIYQCSFCCTDFQLEVVDCDRKGIALVITRWLDLGSGLDPDDPKWRRHLYIYGYGCLVTQPVGVLRSHFEQKSEVSLDALTRRNESLLKSYWFRGRMILEGNKAMVNYMEDRSYFMYLP
jgi:hypothetical protein